MQNYNSYLIIFNFLDYYYFHVNHSENKKGFLGAMLGSMSPGNESYTSIPDITFYYTWNDIINQFFYIYNNYLDCFIKYAEFYINKYDFNFLIPVLDYLNTDVGKNKFIEIQKKLLNCD